MEQWNPLLIPFEKRKSSDIGQARAFIVNQHNNLPPFERAGYNPLRKTITPVRNAIAQLETVSYDGLPTRKQYAAWVNAALGTQNAATDNLGKKIDALHLHYLPRMFEDLKQENPQSPSGRVGRFAQVVWELHLMHGVIPKQRLLNILGRIEGNEFHAVAGPLAKQYASKVLEAYVQTKEFQAVGLSETFATEADPFNTILCHMGDFQAFILLNSMELAGEEVATETINNRLHQAVRNVPVLEHA